MAEIVLAYGDWEGTTGAYLVAAFEKLGHNVSILPLRRRWRGRMNVVVRHFGKRFPYVSWIDARGWMKANKITADLFLWIESPRSLDVRVKRPFPCPNAAYVIDTHTRGPELRLLAKQYDLVFVAQKEDADAFLREGFNAQWMPLAADPDVHRHIDVPLEFDVGFVGNIESERYKDRYELLRELSKRHRVHVTKAFGVEMSREYSRCKIGFNKSLKGDLNMRVFEIMATGLPLVTDRIANGLTDLFKEGTHFLGYSDNLSLDEAVDGLLGDEDARRSLALAARERVLAEHTYVHRAHQILSWAIKGTG